MKGIVFTSFSITVDFCICFKFNGEFKNIQIIVKIIIILCLSKMTTTKKRCSGATASLSYKLKSMSKINLNP